MKTLIIHAKQGEGKTRAIPLLLQRYGQRTVIDDWNGYSPLPAGALALTHCQPTECLGALVMTLDDALS